MPYENLEPLADSVKSHGLRLASAGKCIRGITACPGTYCKAGLFDTQTLADKLHKKFGTRDDLPHKFKIAIAGCRNSCTKPQENDIGIQGTKDGYVVFVGGKMGKQPRLADRLPQTLASESQLFTLVAAALDWYVANGSPGERFGGTIDRLGLAPLLAAIEHA